MTFLKKPLALASAIALVCRAFQPGAAFAQKGEAVKIAWIDPLSA